MLKITNIKMPVGHSADDVKKKAATVLGVVPEALRGFTVVKKSLDARDKNDIAFIYSVTADVQNETRYTNKPNVTLASSQKYTPPKLATSSESIIKRPVVIGMGPAGLFSALILAEAGLRPLVFEQGKDALSRKADVDMFFATGVLNPRSNVQFGEGGAGTFSDGKLTTGINDIRIQKVLETFVEAGAPEEIIYSSKPHIGTDKLIDVVMNIRKRIVSLGGEVFFDTRFTGFTAENGALKSVTVERLGVIETDVAILAIGHSSRDTFATLCASGVKMLPKPFSVGVRIEHSQELISKSQYGKLYASLGAADYKLNTRLQNGRGVYTFCMCPGGYVVAAASEPGALVTNGMSYYARAGTNANSALLVSVTPEDYRAYGDDPLAGIAFQRDLEHGAYALGGGGYKAPVQLVGDFMNARATTRLGDVKPTYTPGVTPTDLSACLPPFVTASLREAIPALDKRLRGFSSQDAVMTAVESRSSSPVRIPRDECYSANIRGILPCGEGAGYAGGIMSSAVDGIKCAENAIHFVVI